MIDVLIVGGGPAGLSAALLLGRCRRRVLICDAGQPRNAAAKVFNGYLSRDASSPYEFLEIGRKELQRYETVEFRHAVVRDVERKDKHFVGLLQSGELVVTRSVLFASGVVDELPAIEGLRQFYGSTVHSCPFCDGWECRDQAIAVAGGDQAAADLAIELRQWSKDVVLCANGPLTCNQKTRKQLKRSGIRVEEKLVARLEGEGDALKGVRYADGTRLAREALFFSPVQHQHSDLPERLGCKICAEDGCIQCGEDMQTRVPGAYAVGNASRGMQLVIIAAAEGTRAAAAINDALVEADFAEDKFP